MPYVPGGGSQKNSSLDAVGDVYHSPNVFANFVPMALWQNPSGTEAAAFAGISIAINLPTFAEEAQVIEAVEGETTDQRAVEVEQRRLIAAGVISQEAIAKGNTAGANPAAADTTPGTAVAGETAGAVEVGGVIDETFLCDGPQTGTKYYVKTVTKQPGVVFPYDVATVAPQNGISVQEVCDNLRLLIINCFDPIKKQYPDAFMTCSFRKGGVGSPTSQHPKGMACDIQYAGASKAEYYTRAQWVKDNISYDQFILEFKTTGTGKPWHHISFNKAGNRSQVLTFMNDKNCRGPGVTGLFDLSNA